MQIRLPCVAAVVVVVVSIGVGRQSQAAPSEEKRLLILEAPGNVLTKTARERLHAAIAEVVAGRGLTLASTASLPEKLLACPLPGCLSPIAAASGAIFVMRVEAKFTKESFKLAIELWNSDEGKLLGQERRDCPICDEQDLWGSAAFIVRELLDRIVHNSTPPTLAAAAAPPSRHEPRQVAPPSLTQAPAGSAVPVLRYTGLALSVAGLAALVTGIYYWSVDGEHAGATDSDLVRDTRKFGLPMTIAGGVALAAGAGMVAWSFWAGPARISVAPSGVRIAGRF
jgi:hypothetical protein